MAERASDRLLRLLGMVTYLDRTDGVPIDQVAAHFGVTPAQVVDDIDTLWVTGTPGYWPHDLIDPIGREPIEKASNQLLLRLGAGRFEQSEQLHPERIGHAA